MGGGSYSADTSRAASSLRAATGTPDFGYDHDVRTGKVPTAVAPDLDPGIKAGSLSPFAGAVMRESRDSDEHPESLAIVVIFDETGSMREVPERLVKKLPDLFPMIIRKGYVLHPHLMFAAVGDANSDRVPIQVGQFESDNRCEEQLLKVYLEGNGGGGHPPRESYELMLWFIATHTHIDCYEKRGHKGYCFLIADESPYARVDPRQVEKFCGVTLEEPISTEAAVALLQEKYNVFVIRPEGTSYRPGTALGDQVVANWRALVGPQNVIDLPDDKAKDGTHIPATDLVCETIAVTIGLMEGAIDDVDAGIADLNDAGSNVTGAGLSRALALVGSGTGGGGLATSAAPGGLDAASGVETL